jgi:16S rRNA (uracil1498-N3)-methyltransferase
VEPVRFYCRSISKSSVQLSAEEIHHLTGVRRLGRGDKVELFDGNGTLAGAEITAVSPRKITLQVQDVQTIPRPANPQIIIAVSVAKGNRFDWLIGKCTELSVDRICPVIFERTVKQPQNPKIVERWQNISIAAAKQCRRIFLPQIDIPLPLRQVLENLKKDFPNVRFLFGSLAAQAPALISVPFGPADVAAFIGPEGGFTEQEETLLQSHDCQPVRLTDTILRTETAALAFAAIFAAQRNRERL